MALSSSFKPGSYALGLFFIFLVSCSWAGASVLIQYIYRNLAFDSPFVITYICTSLFSIYLPWVFACGKLGLGENPPLHEHEGDGGGDHHQLSETSTSLAAQLSALPTSPSSTQLVRETTTRSVLPADHLPLKGPGSSTSDEAAGEERPGLSPARRKRWSHERTLRVARVICPLWFIANFTYNGSLAMTSVTSNTIISTTSSLWTFLFSTFYGLEGFSWLKLGGLAVSFVGTVLVGASDKKTGTDTVVGDALCLFSAVMYGVYTTALRVLVPDDTVISFQLLFGYIGLLNAVLLSPVLIILAYSAPQVFAGFTATAFGFIVMNGLCDNVLSDYFWARAIVLTSPTVATVGLSLTIPLAFLSDTLLGRPRNGAMEVFGALGVVAGFFMVSYRGKEGQDDNSSRRGHHHQPVPLTTNNVDTVVLGEYDDDDEEREPAVGLERSSGRLLSQV